MMRMAGEWTKKREGRSQRDGTQQGEGRKQRTERIYEEGSDHRSRRRSTQPSDKSAKRSRKKRSKHRKYKNPDGQINKRYNVIGPNGDDSRGVAYDHTVASKRSALQSLPPLSPKDFAQLKPPNMDVERNSWQRKRDFQLKNTLKKYRTKDEEEEHRLRRKLARQKKERSLRKEKKSRLDGKAKKLENMVRGGMWL